MILCMRCCKEPTKFFTQSCILREAESFYDSQWFSKLLEAAAMGSRNYLEASDMCLSVLGWFSWKEAMLYLRSQQSACQIFSTWSGMEFSYPGMKEEGGITNGVTSIVTLLLHKARESFLLKCSLEMSGCTDPDPFVRLSLQSAASSHCYLH